MNEKKLLLVDDEEGIRKVLGITLADAGYQVLIAEDAARALSVFRRELPAIVLTDIKMPGMDGIELLRRIKSENPDAEVIMITGHGDMDLAIRSLENEATHFVTKPIDDDALEKALRRAHRRIEARRKEKELQDRMETLLEELTGEKDGPEGGDGGLPPGGKRELTRIGARLRVSMLALERLLTQNDLPDLERLKGVLQEVLERINALAETPSSENRHGR